MDIHRQFLQNMFYIGVFKRLKFGLKKSDQEIKDFIDKNNDKMKDFISKVIDRLPEVKTACESAVVLDLINQQVSIFLKEGD